MCVPCPIAVNAACGMPSTTALKICADPLSASWAASDVPEKRATNPLPDQEKRGWAGIEVVSTRPNQRTPAATTPAGGCTGLFASTEGVPESTGGKPASASLRSGSDAQPPAAAPSRATASTATRGPDLVLRMDMFSSSESRRTAPVQLSNTVESELSFSLLGFSIPAPARRAAIGRSDAANLSFPRRRFSFLAPGDILAPRRCLSAT